ncbi:MAG: hypothetical protein J5614_08855 [Paludibacteraceae bacterium]|nr:hypothetical protein [Paludibacteraceae bacterium]
MWSGIKEGAKVATKVIPVAQKIASGIGSAIPHPAAQAIGTGIGQGLGYLAPIAKFIADA